jgi:Na+(H+)/acetate symporter ActP
MGLFRPVAGQLCFALLLQLVFGVLIGTVGIPFVEENFYTVSNARELLRQLAATYPSVSCL